MKVQFAISEENSGRGKCILRWRPKSHTLAAACANNAVVVYDKRGDIIDALDFSAPPICIEWDREGDCLAIVVANSSQVTLWDVNSHSTDVIDASVSSSKDNITCVAWSDHSPVFAVGNVAGSTFIYNYRAARKEAVIGKHHKPIREISFSALDNIITCGDDNMIIVSNHNGECLSTNSVTGDPSLLRSAIMSGTMEMISACLDKKVLMFAKSDTSDSTVNLQFLEHYGVITNYYWYGDGLVLASFQNGMIVGVTAKNENMGTELFHVSEYNTGVKDLCILPNNEQFCSIGERKLPSIIMNLCNVLVSDDGQLVAISNDLGAFQVLITKLPAMGAAYLETVASLTGLSQVTITSETIKKQTCILDVGVEASILALGPFHLAVAANSRVLFFDYSFTSNVNSLEKPQTKVAPINQVEYLSTVLDVQINRQYAAVSMNGRVRLQKRCKIYEGAGFVLGAYWSPPPTLEKKFIQINEAEDEKAMTFPEASRTAKLLAVALTEDFLIYTTDTNYIVYFSLTEWAVVSEYRHESPLKNIFPHPYSVSCCVSDDRMDTFIYSPVDDSLLKLPAVGSTLHCKGTLWETFTIDKDTFLVYDTHNLYVFLLTKKNVGGEGVVFVGSTKLPYGYKPLALSKGLVKCLTDSGQLSSVLLESHKTDFVFDKKSPEEMMSLLEKALRLKRWTYAWKMCEFTNDLLHWNEFALAALGDVDVKLAIRIFRNIEDVPMVAALEQLQHIEEKCLLSAHVSVILHKYDEAEELFLKSSEPIEALNMRRDLLEWSQALQLAQKLDPQQIPYISMEYAQELELLGDAANALENYEKGIIHLQVDSLETQEHNEICNSGIARMSIKTGDLRRGIQLAKSLEGRVIKRDCAIILEQLKQYTEAAQLYEIGMFYDRAAAVCLKANAWGKAAELMPKVKSPKIHCQFAKVMEAEKKYKQAAQSYERGRDYDNLVRILLDHLRMTEEAVKVVRDSRSVEGAKLVAKFFSRLGDHSSAIQFLVMSQCIQEALQVAEAYDCMGEYVEAIDEFGSPEQAAELAEHILKTGDTFNAARLLMKGTKYNAALKLLLTIKDRSDAILLAIECTKMADDPQATKNMINYLTGQSDGVAKESSYLFRLYVELGMVKEAATTALIVAREHQARGNYRHARHVLLKMYMTLEENDMLVPREMDDALMILHSYMIVKPLLGRGDPLLAARMLIRTCDNISKFPNHVVQILTSAVVVCTQAGLKKSAHRYAAMLMKPEYRPKIHEKYKKKIEDLVRRSSNLEQKEEERSPCPHCGTLVEMTSLSCNSCKNRIPYCVVTGRNIDTKDFAQCPNCKMPGYYSELRKISECYMCGSDTKEVIPGNAADFMKRYVER